MGDRAWETGLNQPPLQRLPGTATDFIISEIEKPVGPFILDFFHPSSFPPPSTYSGCNHQQIRIPRAEGVRGKPERRLQPPPGWEWRDGQQATGPGISLFARLTSSGLSRLGL